MIDAKGLHRFIEEDFVVGRQLPQGSSPTPQRSNSSMSTVAEEQPVSLRSRFPIRRTQTETQANGVRVFIGSPTKHYDTRYRLKFGYSFTIVTSTTTPLPLMMRSITGPSTNEQVQRLQQLRHPNIIDILELYTCPKAGNFLVSEFLPTTVQHFCRTAIYPTETQLSSILHQVLNGINFLLTSGLVYEQVSAFNLLVSPAGQVKICDVDRCSQGGDVSKLLESFTRLMMKLMDKEKLEDAVPGLTRPDRWSTEAIDMFTEAVSNSSVQELLGHRFLHKRDKKELVWLVNFVLISARHTYE